jgi:hypothetical protein
VDATVQAAQVYVAGRAAAAGVVPALALALGDEVIRALAMSQWKHVFFALAALGATSAAAVGLAWGGRGQEAPTPARTEAPGAAAGAAPAKDQPQTAVKKLPEPVEEMIPKQAIRLRNAASQCVDAMRAFYEEGRITIDRYIHALQLLNAIELEQAKTRDERIIAAQTHVERTLQLLKKEQAELKAGRGTIADVAEAQLANEKAIAELLTAHKAPQPGDVEVLQKRVGTLEKRLEQISKHLERTGLNIDVDIPRNSRKAP